MAGNSFLKPEVIANTAIGLLERELVLGSLVWTDHGINFAGAKGDAVTIRVPARTTARELEWRGDRAGSDFTGIQLDTLTEASQVVTLNHHLYSAVPVTDEELTLDVDDFGQRVLEPQVRAVATEIDNRIAAMISGADYETELTADPADPWKAVVDARTQLNRNNVGREGRVLLCGPDFEAAMLKSDRLSLVDHSGDPSALREATVGRMAGFTVIASNAIPADEAYAFVPSAFLVATRAPIVPAGAAFGAAASFAGYAMRWLRDYDASLAQDRSVVSCFAGLNIMLDQENPGDGSSPSTLKRAVKLVLGEAENPS